MTMIAAMADMNMLGHCIWGALTRKPCTVQAAVDAAVTCHS